MTDPNEESIRDYEKRCRSGGPLRLLSVHCTIRQTSRHIKRRVSVSNTPLPKCSRKKESSEKGYDEKPVQKINNSCEPFISASKKVQENLNLDGTLPKIHKILPDIQKNSTHAINPTIDPKVTKPTVCSSDVASSNVPTFGSNILFNKHDSPQNYIESLSIQGAFDSQAFGLEDTTRNPQSIAMESSLDEVDNSVQNREYISFPKLVQTANFPASKSTESCVYSNNSVQDSKYNNSESKEGNIRLPVNSSLSSAPNIISPICTPVRSSRLIATCISSANRSPFKGLTGKISQSPTIKLGKKIFHVPGSILLGTPDIIQDESKKKPQSRRSKKKDPDVSKCDLTLIDTSNPYDFVLGKRTEKIVPVSSSSAQLVADMLKPAPSQQNNILLDLSDEEIDPESNTLPASFCSAHHAKQTRTPLHVRSKLNQTFSPSPLRKNSDKAETSPEKYTKEPLEDSLHSMFDLSQQALPDLADVGLLIEPPEEIQKENSEKGCSEPIVSSSFFPSFSGEMDDLFNASQESLDLQAFLEKDLGYFNRQFDY